MPGQYPIFAAPAPNMYNPFPSNYPVNYYDPYFMKLMQQYGNIRNGPQFQNGGIEREKRTKRYNNEYYDSEDPKNQRFMKIKEYLDNRESEFLKSGNQIKPFESHKYESYGSPERDFSSVKTKKNYEKRGQDYIREIENFTPNSDDMSDREIDDDLDIPSLSPGQIISHFTEDETVGKKAKVDYFSKPVEIKSPVKFTIQLENRQQRKFKSKKRNAFLEIGNKRENFGDYENRPEFIFEDEDLDKESEFVNCEELTPESCYKENFEPFKRIRRFEVEDKTNLRRRSNSK